jgi:energy-coupling factor transporter ATP-binding protein EcfA2
MLKRLHLQNFTVFADADFEFGPGLNVLVGTNGTGKSHVLKVGYSIESAYYNLGQHSSTEQLIIPSANTVAWTATLYKLLPQIFLSAQIGPLIRWSAKQSAIVSVDFRSDEKLILELEPASLNPNVNQASLSVELVPKPAEVEQPVFIPAKEILTLSWMLPGSEQLVLPIEQNYLDLLKQLRRLPLRQPESGSALEALTAVLGGEVNEEEGRYYLIAPDGRRTGIGLVAEGLRKFGTLQKLLANGGLTKQTTLYWDEPEANLNPALLQKLAAILAELARQGFQIILATHSTDLLKEFHILSRQKDAKSLPIKYFGLNAKPGEATTVITTDNFEHLPDVVALEVELKQADELEEIFIREDREYYANHPGEQSSL